MHTSRPFVLLVSLACLFASACSGDDDGGAVTETDASTDTSETDASGEDNMDAAAQDATADTGGTDTVEEDTNAPDIDREDVDEDPEADVTIHDVAEDVEDDVAVDAEEDVAAEDTEEDVAVDTVEDTAEPDVAMDAEEDIAADMEQDIADAEPDVTMDAAVDAEPDAALDAEPDVTMDAAVDAEPDVAPDAEPDAMEGDPTEVRVWRRVDADMSVERFQAIAQILEIEGDVRETAELFWITEATEVGPTGPFTATLSNGGGSLSWTTTVDFRESPGTVSGSIDDEGMLTVTALDLPPATKITDDGGIIAVEFALTEDGSGAVNLDTSHIDVNLPMEGTASCMGAGCWPGTCAVTLGTLMLSSDRDFGAAPYNPETGSARISGDIIMPQIASCTDAVPEDVAEQIGIGDPWSRWRLDFTLDPAFGSRSTSLTMDRQHGHVSFVMPGASDAPARTALPTNEDARLRATELLDSLGLTPPNPMVTVARRTNEDDAETEVVVRFMPRLAVNADGDALGMVRHTGAFVLLGDDGALLGLESHWAHSVEAGPMVPSIPRDEAWTLLGRGEGDELEGIQLMLGYVGFEDDIEQPFYDPVWTVIGTDGTSIGIVPATGFTPRLGLDGLEPNTGVELDGPLMLTALATQGTPPYQFAWRSSLMGDLGTGESIDAELTPGRHTIVLQVRDANGAGISGHFPVDVLSSPFEGGNGSGGAVGFDDDEDVNSVMNVFPRRVGASYIVSSRQDRVGPKVTIRNGRGMRAGAISMGQWRYKMKVNVAGGEYIIQSSKCSDESREGYPACSFPSDDGFTITTNPSPVRWSGSARQAHASVSYISLPGTLNMSFQYSAGNFYAGPKPKTHERAGAWLAVGGLAPNVGGTASGLRPQVNWSYSVPSGDESNACTPLYAIWFISQFVEGDPEDAGYTTLTEGLFEPCWSEPFFLAYEVTEIEVEIFTLVEPPAAPGHYSTLVNDGPNHTARLDATDGPLDYSGQPGPQWILGDGMTEITPIPNERSANAARPNAAGDWDNWHSKFAPSPYFVTFPGCNSVLADQRLIDWRPCLHLHERWFNQPTYSKGQTVDWHLMADFGVERDPPGNTRPSSYVNGSVIRGIPQLLWHESTATSAQCEGNGSVDNSGRPCRVFPSPVFETH